MAKIENIIHPSGHTAYEVRKWIILRCGFCSSFEWVSKPRKRKSINFFLSVDCALKCVDILHYCINTVRDSVTRFFCWPRLFHGSNPSGTLVHMLKYFLNGLDFAEIFSVCKTPWCHWHRGLMLDWIRISQRNWSHI